MLDLRGQVVDPRFQQLTERRVTVLPGDASVEREQHRHVAGTVVDRYQRRLELAVAILVELETDDLALLGGAGKGKKE
ncbi:MAG: hypothetical protein HC897_11395 [Thermoanaerobaculia bacterium]|nr:hypothetical protein [Thermoanaerobaculia bacterium]